MSTRVLMTVGVVAGLLAAPGAVAQSAAFPEVALTVPEDTAKAEKPAAKAATAIEVATGSVKFSGNVQAWYVDGGDVTSTFRVRRAELKFAGELNPNAKWTVMVDPAKALRLSNGSVNQGSMLLQDAYVTVKLGALEVDAGQLKLPLTREGAIVSSAKLETVERAAFISEGKLGNVRDLGFLASLPLPAGISAQLGVFNGVGDGQNTVDVNDAKVLTGRLEASALLPGLDVGASGAWGGEESEENVRRDRFGADALYTAGQVTVRSEWMRGWDGETTREGYYGLAAYRLSPRWEVVGRYDVWDRDTRSETSAADVRERSYVAGISHLLTASTAKVQVSYGFRDFGGVLPTGNLLLINLQTAW